jgi:sugar diacid utilization regulator
MNGTDCVIGVVGVAGIVGLPLSLQPNSKAVANKTEMILEMFFVTTS